MKINIRVKSVAPNGASAALTWEDVECENQIEAFKKGMELAIQSPFLTLNTAKLEIWFPSSDELEKERNDWIWEETLFEQMCGSYQE